MPPSPTPLTQWQCLGHVCTLKFVSHSQELPGAIARLIYVYSTVRQINFCLDQIVPEAVSEHKIYLEGMPPDPPGGAIQNSAPPQISMIYCRLLHILYQHYYYTQISIHFTSTESQWLHSTQPIMYVLQKVSSRGGGSAPPPPKPFKIVVAHQIASDSSGILGPDPAKQTSSDTIIVMYPFSISDLPLYMDEFQAQRRCTGCSMQEKRQNHQIENYLQGGGGGGAPQGGQGGGCPPPPPQLEHWGGGGEASPPPNFRL